MVGVGGGFCPPPPPPLPDPPHALSENRPTVTATMKSENNCGHRFLKPNQPRASATEVTGTKGIRAGPLLLTFELVATVKVVEIDAPPGVTVEGEKLHDAPAGSPEHANDTAWLNPLSGAMLTWVVAVPPPVTVKEVGDSVSVKSGTGKLIT